MTEGEVPELVVSGSPYFLGMRIKIEYYPYWWQKYLVKPYIIEGTIAGYFTDKYWSTSYYSVCTNDGYVYRVTCKNIVRMWHYVAPKIDCDLGI